MKNGKTITKKQTQKEKCFIFSKKSCYPPFIIVASFKTSIISFLSFFLSFKVSSAHKSIVAHKEQLDEHSDRIYAMSEHLRNVQQELQHTQVLATLYTPKQMKSVSKHQNKLARACIQLFACLRLFQCSEKGSPFHVPA